MASGNLSSGRRDERSRRRRDRAGRPARVCSPPRAGIAAQAPAAPRSGLRRQRYVRGLSHRQGDTLKGTPHAQAKNPRSPAATQGCESCHGPGQAHVDDDAKGNIRKFAQIKPAEINQTCLTCHNRGEHAGWEGSGHERRNLSCTTCHSVHSPKSAGAPAGQADRDPAVRHVPSPAGGQDRARRGAHAGAGGQDVVHVLP